MPVKQKPIFQIFPMVEVNINDSFQINLRAGNIYLPSISKKLTTMTAFSIGVLTAVYYPQALPFAFLSLFVIGKLFIALTDIISISISNYNKKRGISLHMEGK